MQNLDRKADYIQIPVLTKVQLEAARMSRVLPQPQPEPSVPYRSIRGEDFQADAPYDFVCLTRSPPYTPATADPLFDAIRSRFVRDEGQRSS